MCVMNVDQVKSFAIPLTGRSAPNVERTVHTAASAETHGSLTAIRDRKVDDNAIGVFRWLDLKPS